MGAGGQRGFSLLELLVTLLIIVLVTSLVSLSFSSGGWERRLEAQVRALADVAGYALDEAQLTGRDYGLLVTREDIDGEPVAGYAWRERLTEGWRPPPAAEEVFAAGRLPPEVELQLELEEAPAVEPVLGRAAADATPQVIMYASGEITPGRLDVMRRDTGELLWRVRWDLLGRFELLPRGEEEPEEEQGE